MINYTGTPTLETDRLILRKVELSDAQSIFDHWLSDERVTDNLIRGAHQSVAETIERVNEIVSSYGNPDFFHWVIELKATGDLIGTIDFFHFDTNTESCQVGYALGYRWWNQGYGTETLRAVVEFGFRHLNLHKISAAHNVDNPASGTIMRKVGMQQEGTIRHMIRNSKNQYKDCTIYGILQEDYFAHHAETQP